MGLAEFNSIDIVTQADDGERWLMVTRWPEPDDARLIALFLLKLAAYERHAAHQDMRIHLELSSTDEPPACVVEIAARRDIAATVGIAALRAVATGRPTAFPSTATGWPDLDALQSANARTCAEQHRLPF